MKYAAAATCIVFVTWHAAQSGDRAVDWVQVTDKAAWQARDSQGEVVYKDQLWIFGGWFDSFKPAPRDVWSTSDGRSWELVTRETPWKHSDLSMSLVHDDRMWMMGGWYNGRMPGHEAGNEVWSSTDGATWQQAAAHAGWSPRIAAAAVVFQKKMWILGGTENYYFGDERSLKNDVWSSSDGKTWTLVTPHAAWSPRAYHQAVVLGDKIYLFGGGSYVPIYEARSDVWMSSDGAQWEKIADAAPWHPRLWFPAVVYRDRMWVLGGWSNNPSKNWGDVWYSRDGKNWQQLLSKTTWKERHEHSAYVWRDKMWIAGGHAQPLSSEVWSLEIPPDWFEGDD
jgi:hypothetical protein